jgi:hypothetical protein
MDENKKELRRALLLCGPYVLIVFFLDDLDKLLYTIHSRLGNPLLALYVIVATVIIFALFIHTLLDLTENYKASGYMALLPMIIYLFSLTNSFWSPLRISSEIFHSKIVYRAFRREKYGHAQLKMRQNGCLDIRYPGPFGMSDWEYGKWKKEGDTFFLHYDRALDSIFVKPDTLTLASDGLLTPIGIPDDTLKLYKDLFFRMPVARNK